MKHYDLMSIMTKLEQVFHPAEPHVSLFLDDLDTIFLIEEDITGPKQLRKYLELRENYDLYSAHIDMLMKYVNEAFIEHNQEVAALKSYLFDVETDEEEEEEEEEAEEEEQPLRRVSGKKELRRVSGKKELRRVSGKREEEEEEEEEEEAQPLSGKREELRRVLGKREELRRVSGKREELRRISCERAPSDSIIDDENW